MIRIMSSTVNFVASQPAGTKMVSAIAGLTDVIPSTALAKPLGLIFPGTVDAGIKVTQILFRSTKNPEVVYRVYKGVAMELEELKEVLKPDADGTPFTVTAFNPEHGLEVEVEYESSTTPYNREIIWKLANRFGGESAGAASGGAIAVSDNNPLGSAPSVGSLNAAPLGQEGIIHTRNAGG